jgi:hypothetical protein
VYGWCCPPGPDALGGGGRRHRSAGGASGRGGGRVRGTGAGWCPLESLGKGIVKWRGPRRIEQGDPLWVSASPRAAMSH